MNVIYIGREGGRERKGQEAKERQTGGERDEEKVRQTNRNGKRE